MSLFELQLIPCDWMSEFITVQARQCEYKRWMQGRCYQRRVQKKWDKQYGVETKRQIIQDGRHLFAHPNTIQLITNNRSVSIGGSF